MIQMSIKMKTCTKCHNSYPATKEYFFAQKLGKDGLESQCKECVKKRRRRRYKNIIYEIYCIPTDTYYIGQTIKPITERISKHFSDAKLGREQPLYEDMRKYNRNDFEYKEIHVANKEEELDGLERFYISQYLKDGKKLYNRENGGKLGCELLKNIIDPFVVCDAYGYVYGEFTSKKQAFKVVGRFDYDKLINNTQLNRLNLLVFSLDKFSYDLYAHECHAYTYLEDIDYEIKEYRNDIKNKNKQNNKPKPKNNTRDVSGENNPMYGKHGKSHPSSKPVICIKDGIIERFESAQDVNNKYNFQAKSYARGVCNHYYKKLDMYVYYEEIYVKLGLDCIRADKQGIEDTNID